MAHGFEKVYDQSFLLTVLQMYLPIERQRVGASLWDIGDSVGDSESHLGKEFNLLQSVGSHKSSKLEQSTDPFNAFPSASRQVWELLLSDTAVHINDDFVRLKKNL
jgi:hypothetical protein